MNLETGKQALMDQLSKAYFSAIELKAEAEKYLAGSGASTSPDPLSSSRYF